MSVDRAVARVNLDAIARNCERLRAELREGVQLCAVVKADGYGHGLLESAGAALAGGATWLAVASVPEARELVGRAIWNDEARLLVLGPLREMEVEEAVHLNMEIVVWGEDLLAEAALLAQDMGRAARVHVKLDTGMGRFGVRDPERASQLVAAAAANPHVELVGVMTHFATADELARRLLRRAAAAFRQLGAARSSGRTPRCSCTPPTAPPCCATRAAHFDMVRCGIAIYGMDPFGEDPLARGLEPALAVELLCGRRQALPAGESAGYGRRFVAAQRDASRRAADRLRRRLAAWALGQR